MRFSVVVGIGLAAVAVLLFLRQSGPDDSAVPGGDEFLAAPGSPDPLPTPQSPPEAAARPAPESTEAAIDARLLARQRAMTEALFQMMGSGVAERLMDSGLALSDGEQIARQYAENLADCATSALTDEAASQSISLEELIARVRRAMQNSDVNVADMSPYEISVVVSDVIDIQSVEANISPCWVDAMQRAGLAFDDEVEAMIEEQLRQE